MIHAFLNRKKIARVSSTPGFTKSINLYLVDFSFYLVDLPGYGFAKAPKNLIKKWTSLIEGYLTSPRNIKILILIFDIRRIPDMLDFNLVNFVKFLNKPYTIVLNKTDTLSTKDREIQKQRYLEFLKLPLDISIFLTSCKTKEGIKGLKNFILTKIKN